MEYALETMPYVAEGLDSFERDCVITVALKITDDSCKMDDYEKRVFMLLYDALSMQETDFFDNDVFDIIQKGRIEPSVHIFSEIKKLRESAMDFITRPKMKAFKATIRKRLSVV